MNSHEITRMNSCGIVERDILLTLFFFLDYNYTYTVNFREEKSPQAIGVGFFPQNVRLFRGTFNPNVG